MSQLYVKMRLRDNILLYFFLSYIVILRPIFKRALAHSGNKEKTYSWQDLVEDDLVSPLKFIYIFPVHKHLEAWLTQVK